MKYYSPHYDKTPGQLFITTDKIWTKQGVIGPGEILMYIRDDGVFDYKQMLYKQSIRVVSILELFEYTKVL